MGDDETTCILPKCCEGTFYFWTVLAAVREELENGGQGRWCPRSQRGRPARRTPRGVSGRGQDHTGAPASGVPGRRDAGRGRREGRRDGHARGGRVGEPLRGRGGVAPADGGEAGGGAGRPPRRWSSAGTLPDAPRFRWLWKVALEPRWQGCCCVHRDGRGPGCRWTDRGGPLSTWRRRRTCKSWQLLHGTLECRCVYVLSIKPDSEKRPSIIIKYVQYILPVYGVH